MRLIKIPLKLMALALSAVLLLIIAIVTFVTSCSGWLIKLFSVLCFFVGIAIYLTGLADGHEALSVLAVGCIAYCVPMLVSTILANIGKIRLDLGKFLRS